VSNIYHTRGGAIAWIGQWPGGNTSVKVQNENVTAPLPTAEPVTASARTDVAKTRRNACMALTPFTGPHRSQTSSFRSGQTARRGQRQPGWPCRCVPYDCRIQVSASSMRIRTRRLPIFKWARPPASVIPVLCSYFRSNHFWKHRNTTSVFEACCISQYRKGLGPPDCGLCFSNRSFNNLSTPRRKELPNRFFCHTVITRLWCAGP
jgi:hypothetical protein